MIAAAWRWICRVFFAVLEFLNVLEDRRAGLPKRLSLTNIAFWGGMALGLGVVVKSVLMPSSSSLTEFAMAGAVSVIAALLKDRKACRQEGRFNDHTEGFDNEG